MISKIESEISESFQLQCMPMWNCEKCDMPLITMDVGSTIKYLHCGKYMVQMKEK